MVRKMIGAFLMVFALLTGMSWAEDGYPQPYTGNLVGTWGFNGGAEEHGDGFRLDADGTGVNLEIVDYEQVPLQFRETDSTFTWRVENVADRVYLHETYADGSTVTHEIETWGGARIHIPNEMSGGFYFPVKRKISVFTPYSAATRRRNLFLLRPTLMPTKNCTAASMRFSTLQNRHRKNTFTA